MSEEEISLGDKFNDSTNFLSESDKEIEIEESMTTNCKVTCKNNYDLDPPHESLMPSKGSGKINLGNQNTNKKYNNSKKDDSSSHNNSSSKKSSSNKQSKSQSINHKYNTSCSNTKLEEKIYDNLFLEADKFMRNLSSRVPFVKLSGYFEENITIVFIKGLMEDNEDVFKKKFENIFGYTVLYSVGDYRRAYEMIVSIMMNFNNLKDDTNIIKNFQKDANE